MKEEKKTWFSFNFNNSFTFGRNQNRNYITRAMSNEIPDLSNKFSESMYGCKYVKLFMRIRQKKNPTDPDPESVGLFSNNPLVINTVLGDPFILELVYYITALTLSAIK